MLHDPKNALYAPSRPVMPRITRQSINDGHAVHSIFPDHKVWVVDAKRASNATCHGHIAQSFPEWGLVFLSLVNSQIFKLFQRSPNLHHAVSAKTPHGLPRPAKGFTVFRSTRCLTYPFLGSHTHVRRLLSLASLMAFGHRLNWWSVTHSTFDLTRLATSLPAVATPPNQRPKSVTSQFTYGQLRCLPAMCVPSPGLYLGFNREKRVKSSVYATHTYFEDSQTSQS